MKRSPLAGKSPDPSMLIDVPKLIAAYFSEKPDVHVESERVSFGTSGHRGSSLSRSFNEHHILAIAQAICEYRKKAGIDGPLFLGMDTHALSKPALASALEVLISHGVEVFVAKDDEYTPTPVISHAILQHNRGEKRGLADGIVVTPSHNPPDEGGFKYNPPHGGPAETEITKWIEARANEWLAKSLQAIPRTAYDLASRRALRHSFKDAYISDLAAVLDMDAIRQVHLGIDPLGGAGVHYWPEIVERYQLRAEIVSSEVDPTFSFMTLDWDGKIRMDPSSSDAMQRLIHLKDRFDLAVGCDTDHDRHGIVVKSGLMPPNHYLTVMAAYLFRHRSQWGSAAAVGKTVVTSSMLDRVASHLGREVYEVPVGFKWFVQGLMQGRLGFVGEESAGASFLRQEGTVWTTDKDGIVPALLAAEITAKWGKDPGEIYRELEKPFGPSFYERIEAPATLAEKRRLQTLSRAEIHQETFAGSAIEEILTQAPGNGAPIGGIKVLTKDGWFAARPSGTEALYKIYAESFVSQKHVEQILHDAQQIVDQALKDGHERRAV